MGADQRTRSSSWRGRLAASNPEAAFVCIDARVDAAAPPGQLRRCRGAAAGVRGPRARQIPALLKLVEVCVDGGLEATMYEAQAQLADAYLERGQAAEARVIAEDLVAREPWERAHIERFRRALIMLKVPDPDTLIAERLSGEVPFIARDLFADRADAAPARRRPPVPPPPVCGAGRRERCPSRSRSTSHRRLSRRGNRGTELEAAPARLQPPKRST